MTRMLILLLCIIANPLSHAKEQLGFKKELITATQWPHYGILLTVLCLGLLVLIKKTRSPKSSFSKGQLIEVIHLDHKTKAYVIDFEEQQFIIAGNQNALTIHPLKHGILHEK